MSHDPDLRSIAFSSRRLMLRAATLADAADIHAPVTPPLTRFMGWDPAPSLEAFTEVLREWLPKMAVGTDLMLVIRLLSTDEFLGMAGLHGIGSRGPEPGIWIKEAAHGRGYGREAIAALLRWAGPHLGATRFVYPVVEENGPSRRLAESLGGAIIAKRKLRKSSGVILHEVVYRIERPVRR